LPPGIPDHLSEGGRGGPAVPAPDPTFTVPPPRPPCPVEVTLTYLDAGLSVPCDESEGHLDRPTGWPRHRWTTTDRVVICDDGRDGETALRDTIATVTIEWKEAG
jgi:hypothetical protein